MLLEFNKRSFYVGDSAGITLPVNLRVASKEAEAIDYRDLRALTARDLITAPSRDGFVFVRQVGSHQRYVHADGRRVTVAPHGRGDTFNVRTLKSMIELQARWTEKDRRRLKLIQ